ncbi:conserved leucine-rich repeat protein [Phlyctema vagabunda]|uniref:Conserved leucine-rich repeat protein n=1 Tax=Phlyctema vagabunda TaxID=108571 RepID=A0ABR4PWN9_9HELO
MDPQQQPPNVSQRASFLPRPTSRLPVPRAPIRPSASIDNLQQQPSRSNQINNPRLRTAASREQLSSSTSTRPRATVTPSKYREPAQSSVYDRHVSSETVVRRSPQQPLLRKSSSNALFRKPSLQDTAQKPQKPPARPISRGREESIREDETFEDMTVEESRNSKPVSRKPRLSLSERTMETLQNIPSSPAVSMRKSSFYNTELPVRPASRSSQSSSRPSSSHTDTSMKPPMRSVSSRPTSSSSSGQTIAPDPHAPTNKPRPAAASFQSTPVKGPSTAKTLRTPSSVRSIKVPGSTSSVNSKLPSPTFDYSSRQQSPSPSKNIVDDNPRLTSGSKTFTGRSLKARPSVSGLFRKPSMPTMNKAGNSEKTGLDRKKVSPTFSNTSSEDRASSSFSPTSTKTNATSESEDQTIAATTATKSSSALREQIAKAKAAKRAAMNTVPTVASGVEEIPVVPTATFDFGLSQDPFNQNADPNGSKGLLRKRIEAARTDGRLNIAAMGFKKIPEEVMNMYNLDSISGGSWAESVDLTRFIAADNEFEEIEDEFFPDIDPRSGMDDDDESKGNQFGGLETLDLHGNLMKAIPMGLRRLELLTTLNLSNNKLDNSCFEVLSQISALRDLKIAGNSLSGALDSSISKLTNLEVLDIQRNALTSLPDGLVELVRLRVLNIAENKISALDFGVLSKLPLVELVARKNNLSGTLIADEVAELPHLQILDVIANSLTGLTNSAINLPALHQLSCSSNRLKSLPDMTTWVSLLTIAAEDNSIPSLPEGFATLPKIKNVDLSGNDLKVLDDRIGAMDSLVFFRVSGNPLREKKFAGMATDDLKNALKARLAPSEPETDENSVDGEFLTPQSTPTRPSSASAADWPVKSGGVLDRSGTKSSSLNPVIVAQIASNNSIKTLELHHNCFKEIPSSIGFFAATLTTLSLAHNEMTSDTFLTEELELPALKELNLSANTFNSLQPLIQNLIAPQLEKLDISFNRLTYLPPLRPYFPNLTTVLASNNTIRELLPESVKGLHVLDCNSNDLGSLNARIGLLGGPGGLQRLDVRGNRFRVPKYTVLEKGTEATLSWLKDRIPVGETSLTDID